MVGIAPGVEASAIVAYACKCAIAQLFWLGLMLIGIASDWAGLTE